MVNTFGRLTSKEQKDGVYLIVNVTGISHTVKSKLCIIVITLITLKAMFSSPVSDTLSYLVYYIFIHQSFALLFLKIVVFRLTLTCSAKRPPSSEVPREDIHSTTHHLSQVGQQLIR